MERKLSTLELTVLGFAWLRGPCSTYAIMKELGSSESTFHKNRAGTAYSVVKRLAESGLLEVGPDGDVRIASSGLEALKAWLKPPIPIGDIAHSADLLRLRFFFLGAISQADRLAFIQESRAGLKELLMRCDALLDENEELGDYFGVLATANMILETRARIQWLDLVRDLVELPVADPGQWAAIVRKRLGES